MNSLVIFTICAEKNRKSATTFIYFSQFKKWVLAKHYFSSSPLESLPQKDYNNGKVVANFFRTDSQDLQKLFLRFSRAVV